MLRRRRCSDKQHSEAQWMSCEQVQRARGGRGVGKGLVVTAKIQRWARSAGRPQPEEGRSRADSQTTHRARAQMSAGQAEQSGQRVLSGGQGQGAVSSALCVGRWSSGGCAAAGEGRC